MVTAAARLDCRFCTCSLRPPMMELLVVDNWLICDRCDTEMISESRQYLRVPVVLGYVALELRYDCDGFLVTLHVRV